MNKRNILTVKYKSWVQSTTILDSKKLVITNVENLYSLIDGFLIDKSTGIKDILLGFDPSTEYIKDSLYVLFPGTGIPRTLYEFTTNANSLITFGRSIGSSQAHRNFEFSDMEFNASLLLQYCIGSFMISLSWGDIVNKIGSTRNNEQNSNCI
jgi:hypothetical protein